MALSIQDSPFADNTHIAAKEPLGLRLVVDNPTVISAGTKERLRVTFDTFPTAGTGMGWSCLGQNGNVEFVSGTPSYPPSFPDDSECAAYVSDIASWIDDALIPYFRSIVVFDAYDIFRSGTNAINFQRRIAAVNGVSITSTTGFTTTNTHLATGAAPIVPEDYFIRLQLLMSADQDGGFFSEKSPWYTLRPQLIPGTGVIVNTELSEVLQSMMQKVDVVPYNNTSWSPINDSVRKIICRYGEYYGDYANYMPVFSEREVRCFNGGRVMGDSASIWNTYKSKFITNRAEVWTDRRLSDWLYFMEPDLEGATQMVVRITCEYSDESIGINTDVIPAGEIGRVIRIPVGFEQVGFTEDPMYGDPQYYIVEVYKGNGSGIPDGGDPIVQAFKFWILPDSDTVTAVQYINFMGLMETQVLDSNVQMNSEWERELSSVETFTTALAMPDYSTHRERANSIQNQIEIECNTGALTRRNWYAAQDIIMSERVWYVNPNSDTKRLAAQVVPGGESINPFSTEGVSAHPFSFKIVLNKQNTNSVPDQLVKG